jgi:hypothetical protein
MLLLACQEFRQPSWMGKGVCLLPFDYWFNEYKDLLQ